MTSRHRVMTDTAACAGHARCHAVAPQIFDLDENGYNITSVREVAAEDLDAVRRAVRACPERAISVHPDTAS